VFVLGKPFKPNLTFTVNVSTCKQLGIPPHSQILDRGDTLIVSDEGKSFSQTTAGFVIKLFSSSLTGEQNKLERTHLHFLIFTVP
jgi:hypothetical protein